MAEHLVAGADPQGQPIFDFDIACPQCEYNLRGLTERRCPECGNAFDPHAVLMAHRDNQPPLPIGWVVRTMYRHPLAFWQTEQVKLSRGPRRLQIFFGLIYLPVLVTMLGAVLVLPRGSAGPNGLMMLIPGLVVQPLFSSLIPYMLCLIHGILCRVGLAMSRQREGVRAAKEIVGYGLIWFGPALVAAIVAGWAAPMLLIAGTAIWVTVTAILAIACTAAACIAWAVTLYQGGKFASGGSWLLGIWCVISNPFWYIIGFAIVMMILR